MRSRSSLGSDPGPEIEPLSRDRVLEAVSPFLRGMLPLQSEEGRALWTTMRRRTLTSTLRSALGQVVRRRRARAQAATQQLYSDSYAEEPETFDAHLEPSGKGNPFKLGDDTLLFLPPNGLFAAYLATLAEVIACLKPASVCEIGSGSGKNLIYLAPRFPRTQFWGYELTRSGVALARRLQAREHLPTNLARLVGRSDTDAMEAIRGVRFLPADAAQLPVRDNAFDLTFTVLALEQMWPILPRVLAEVRRVTRRYAVFLEAFGEANDWLGYLNLLVRNYFRADLARMRAAGFRPQAFLRDLPNKRTFSTAVLVAEVED